MELSRSYIGMGVIHKVDVRILLSSIKPDIQEICENIKTIPIFSLYLHFLF